ncbi:hypothetical protein ADK54_02305 [Streptomyces sp. WM6378]|nr:hypothetical protein ADK54_02305 [Streptomyces sp. WM6378]
MGSELRDTSTGRVLWGLSGTGWLLKAWTSRHGLQELHLTEDELAGKVGRIQATRLLRHSAWTPYLRGQEPYTDLLDAVRDCVAHPDAVLEFPYDWRLPVAWNARILAERARRHLTAWQNHPAHHRARAHRTDQRAARLVFVAHSMGGLVTRAALDGTHDSDLATDTRSVITLGTPFHSAVKAAVILNTGRGTPVPLPHRKLRALCATMPGLHDLLPQYRCLRTGDDVRPLTVSDITALGGNPYLAQDACDFSAAQRHVKLPDHRAVVGTTQATWQSLTLRDGAVEPHGDGARSNSDGTLIRDRNNRVMYFSVHGDGTVYRESASLSPVVTTLPLQHGDLARAESALEAVGEILMEDLFLGPPQGEPGCGIALPDLVTVGEPWALTVDRVDSLAGLTCHVANTDDPTDRQQPTPGWEDGQITARITLSEPGLHRVTLHSHDGHTVSQLVMAAEPDLAETDH